MEEETAPDAFVIVAADAERNYYVQFAREDGDLYGEAVSNAYLKPEHALDEAQMGALESLGWRRPEGDGENWFRTFRPATDADYEEIVDVLWRTVQQAYRLPVDTPLTLTTSWDG